jgi:regulator of sigma E protease
MTPVIIIITLIVFGLCITVHELGHFLAARFSKIRVNKFAIGMGPPILKKTKGETEYSLRLLPIGGYCDMNENEVSDKEDAFVNKPVKNKILVICGGAIMNIVLGIILNVIIVGMMNYVETPVVSDFRPEAESYSAGLRKGDTIVSVGGMVVFTADDLNYKMATISDKKYNVSVKRNGKIVNLKGVTFGTEYHYKYIAKSELANYKAYVYKIGETLAYVPATAEELEKERLYYYDSKLGGYVRIIVSDELAKQTGGKLELNTTTTDFLTSTEKMTFLNVVPYAFKRTISIVQIVWFSIIDLIRGVHSVEEMSGPIGIGAAIGEVVKPEISFVDNLFIVLNITALITVNLGVFNLLIPFPALDGGRLLFLIIEAIFKKPVNQRIEGYFHMVGFALLMILMAFITFNDLGKIFK